MLWIWDLDGIPRFSYSYGMLSPLSFFLIVAGTVVIVRVFLHGAEILRQTYRWDIIPRPALFGLRVHHYVYGMALLIGGVFVGAELLVGIGIGLVIDEVWFIVGLAANDDRYLSASSVLGAALILVCVYFVRDHVLSAILAVMGPLHASSFSR